MSRVLHIPEPGQLVDVRHRRYVVVEVTPSTLPAPVLSRGTLTRQHLVSLSSVEDDALGEDLQVIWEVEPGAATIEKTPLPSPVGFDSPQRLDTFLNAVRWGAASSADVKAIQAPFRSGIDLEDYQLDPVARAIQMPRANLLITDDVGLGKTIEAGLVAQELLIRHRARRILIVCPASLQVQWHDQMRDKFGLEFRIVESKSLSELRHERGIHVNPWTHFPRLITSIDFLKRERPLRLMSEALPAEGESLYPRKFDLLILDEAHNVAPSGRGKYATDSQRMLAIRRIVPHFEHKLFLSATPYNGYRESFSALLELLDNQRFARGVEPDPEQLHTVMVRRLKSELPPRWDGSPLFPKREITALPVAYTQPERDLHQLLQEYSQLRISESEDTTERYATEFVAKLLKKRLFSSPEAFFKTLERHQLSLTEARRRTTVTKRPGEGILRNRIDQLEEEHDNDETLDDVTNEALEVAAPLFREPSQQERALLDQMHAQAERARHRADSKTRLNATQRQLLWRIYELWRERLEISGKETWQQRRARAEALVEQSNLYQRYDAVIIDEAQDLDPSMLRLLIKLCKSPNRLFVTADANQSIYGSGFNWTDVHHDLKFQGRTSILRANYRSTYEIGEAAQSYLTSGLLDHDVIERQYVNNGPVPDVRAVLNSDHEAQLLASFFKKASRNLRLTLGSCAVLCPSERAGRAIASALSSMDIEATFMSGQDLNLTRSGVKVLTLNAAKGLEFPVVALAGFMASSYPVISRDASPEERDEVLARERRTMFVGMTRAMRALLVILPAEVKTPLLQGFDASYWNMR